jgi:hypothetical protein
MNLNILIVFEKMFKQLKNLILGSKIKRCLKDRSGGGYPRAARANFSTLS